MKTKLIWILAVILVSCKSPVITPPVETPPVVIVPVPNVRIYNSAWEIVQEGHVEVSRAVTTIQSYEDYAAEYNLAHTEDQLFVIEGEEVIETEEAPAADAYIVDPATHDIIKEYLDWPRADISDRREIWRFQAMADGGILYVDRVPPPPIVVIDDRPAFEKWALYLIYTIDNTIKYEAHMTTEADFITERAVYQTQVSADGGTTYLIAGRLYP